MPGLFLNARVLNASSVASLQPSSPEIEKSTELVKKKSTELVIKKSTELVIENSMDVSDAPVNDSNFFHASVPLSALALESPLRCSILSSNSLVEPIVDENISVDGSCMHQNDIVMMGAPTQAQLDDRM